MNLDSKFIILMSILFFFSCAGHVDRTHQIIKAKAEIMAKSKSQASGMVKFFQDQKNDRVRISLNLKGLPPNRTMGIHIHENGNCAGEKAKQAGSHFNPLNYEHGSRMESTTHAGDLGNIKSDAQGEVNEQFSTNKISLKEGSRVNILNKAFVIHNRADDLTTQPTGGSGKRIGCGVITQRNSNDKR